MFKAKTRLYITALFIQSLLLKNLAFKVLLISFLFSISLYADAQYNINIDNTKLVNNNVYEFDVVIKNNNATFSLTSYQVSFVFNQEIINDGEITFSYVEGTSELSNIPSVGIGLNLTDGVPKLTFASLPGEDIIYSDYTKIGHFRLQNTNSFGTVPEINFNFEGKITTIFTGSNFADITNLSNYSTINAKESKNSVAQEYILTQNYPNPFNPSTSIEFEIKEDTNVKLAVYNVLGEEVAELVNGEINAGTHKVEFNATNLASGVYVYRLDAGNEFTETKKMMLMK